MGQEMFASRHRIRNAASSSTSASLVNRGNRLREDGGDNVTGGIQEVIGAEGTVLSLIHDVVDVGYEGVESWGENPDSGFVTVHRMTNVLTIRLAESIEQVYGADDDGLDGLEGRNVAGPVRAISPDRPVQVVETIEDLTVFEDELIGLSRDMRRWDVTVAGEVLQPLDPGGKKVGIFIQSIGLETTEDLGTEGVQVDGIPRVTDTAKVPLALASSLEGGRLELIPTTRPRHELVSRCRLKLVSITLQCNRLEPVLTAQDRAYREDTWIGGCN